MPNPSKIVVENCSHCMTEIQIAWDVNEQGYKAYCPVCGKKLMLCNECLMHEPNKGGIGVCDWSGRTGKCFREKAEVKKCVK